MAVISKYSSKDPWDESNFSDVKSIKDSSRYKLIVHGMQESSLSYFLKDPDQFVKNKLLSASVISDEKQGVFTQTSFGLILRVPFQLVLASSPNTNYEDLHVRNSFKSTDELISELQRVVSFVPLLSPNELLEKTPERWYNEVVILGSNRLIDPLGDEISVKISGVFFKKDDPHLRSNLQGMLTRFANKEGLGIINLKSDI